MKIVQACFVAKLLLASLFLASCASSSVDSSKPSDVIRQLVDSIVEGDESRMMGLMSKADRNNFEKYKERLKGVRELIREEGGLQSVTINREAINGNRAVVDFTLKFKNGKEERVDWDLTKEGEMWRFKSF